MTIERVENEVLIRVPASINTDGIQDIIDLIVYRESTSNSKATQKEIDLIVLETKKDRFNKHKYKYLENQ